MNELKITKTTVTRTGELVTDDATYKFEYLITGDSINKISVRVFEKRQVRTENALGETAIEDKYSEIGQMIYEEGTFRIPAIAYSSNVGIYVSTFVEIAKKISTPESSVETPNP